MAKKWQKNDKEMAKRSLDRVETMENWLQLLGASWEWICKAHSSIDGKVQISCEGCAVQIDISAQETIIEDGSAEDWTLPTTAFKKSIYAITKTVSADFYKACEPLFGWQEGKIKVIQNGSKIEAQSVEISTIVPQTRKFLVKRNSAGGQCMYLSLLQGSFAILYKTDHRLQDWDQYALQTTIIIAAIILKRETIDAIYFILRSLKEFHEGSPQRDMYNSILAAYEVDNLSEWKVMMQTYYYPSRYSNEIELLVASELMGIHVECLIQRKEPGFYQLQRHCRRLMGNEGLSPSVALIFNYPQGAISNMDRMGHYELLIPHEVEMLDGDDDEELGKIFLKARRLRLYTRLRILKDSLASLMILKDS